jgi:hypothetical protein
VLIPRTWRREHARRETRAAFRDGHVSANVDLG